MEIAAKETLVSMNLWQDLNKKIVRGENIAQTFQFVRTGNAELGFISYSQILDPILIWRGLFGWFLALCIIQSSSKQSF